METLDRFIPNRSKMDIARVRASLLHKPSSTSTTKTPADTFQDSEYTRQLRWAFFGSTDTETPMMFFGPKSTKRSKLTPTQLFVEANNPFRQDVLRPASVVVPSSTKEQLHPSSASSMRRPQRVYMDVQQALDAPNMLPNENYTLIGQGKDYLAVALYDKVYLWQQGEIDLLCCEAGYYYSSIQWSQNGELLAIGSDGGVLVFCPQKNKKEPILELCSKHLGHVTAIAWNQDHEFVCCCQNGITRYNLQDKKSPAQATYEGHGETVAITSLLWTENTIISAATSTGEIKIWDARKCGRNLSPVLTMNHKDVRCLEINPRQPNMLVSGGEGGLKFWNLYFGKLRAEIPMAGVTVTRILCSSKRDEILVAYNDILCLWSLTPRVEKLMQHRFIGMGKINDLIRGPDGNIVCGHDDESLTFCSFRREVPKEIARAAVKQDGLLNTITIR